MTKFGTGLTAVIATAAFSFATLVESDAAPLFIPKMAAAKSDAIQVGGRHWRRGYRNGWYGGGALVAGALIGSAIASNRYYDDRYYGNSYYGDPYYANRYYRPRYQQRVYYPPRDAYRQGFNDGYRAGFNDAAGRGITCNSRLQDAGKC